MTRTGEEVSRGVVPLDGKPAEGRTPSCSSLHSPGRQGGTGKGS